MKDFGNDSYSGDCFSYVGILKGLNCNNASDFVEILKIINQDLSLGLDESDNTSGVSSKSTRKPEFLQFPQQPEALKKTKPYSVVQQSFSVAASGNKRRKGYFRLLQIR
jgi:hypothetical protein